MPHPSLSPTPIDIRPGAVGDVPLLLAFIHRMAGVEKLEVTATEESLREALFGDSPAARLLIVSAGGAPIGYLTYFFTFATMVGRRGLWLDDIYLDPAWRSRGIGRALMAHLAGIAARNGCARFEWMVQDGNTPALGFYRRLGADILAEWRICRLEGDRLAALATSGGDG